jgi:methyltransferase (TIGR00027 family)
VTESEQAVRTPGAPTDGASAKRSAEGNAALRYAGSFNRRRDVANPDHLAGLFLGRKFRLLTNIGPLRRAFLPLYRRLYPGAYYYQVARTKLFDAVLREQIGSGAAKQLVILGAGYDTRAHRFKDTLRGVPTFEVDYPATLARKLELLDAGHDEISNNVTYVSADFNTDDWRVKLRQAGFDETLPTLILWEGVCMFIDQAAGDATLALSAALPPGSSILFDYVLQGALEHPERYLGGRQIANFMRNGDEPWTFGVEHDDVEGWLHAHDLELLALYRPEKLESDFLGTTGGKRPVLGIHGVAHAGVRTRGAS